MTKETQTAITRIMRLRIFSAICLVTAIFLISCLDQIRDKVNDQLFPRNNSQPIIQYGPYYVYSDDLIAEKPLVSVQKNCTSANALKDLGSDVPIWIVRNSKYEQVKFDFTGVSGQGLVSQYTNELIVDFEQKNKYSQCEKILKQGVRSQYKCENFSQEIINMGKPLNICQNGGFPRESLENAALSSLASLLKSFRAFAQYTHEKKIQILLFPRFNVHIEYGGEVINRVRLDNAFWTTMSRGGKKNQFSVAMLNHSVNKRPFFRFDLWAQLGVGSHELGHSYFFINTRKLFPHITDNSFQSNQLQQVFYLTRRQINTALAISSINEAFADLFAHYTCNSGVETDCAFSFGRLKKARNISSDVDDSSEAKILTQKILNEFFSVNEIYNNNRLRQDHQDVHTIGAIVGNFADHMFQLRSNSTPDDQKTDSKKKLLIDWSKEINRIDLMLFQTPQLLLREMVLAVVRVSALPNKTLTQNMARMIKSRMPAYSDYFMSQFNPITP